jgi:hypothetical protein
VLRGGDRLEPVRRQLGDYFDRRLQQRFDLPVDLALAGSFGRAVLTALGRGPVRVHDHVRRRCAPDRSADRVACGRPGARRESRCASSCRATGCCVSTARLLGYAGGCRRRSAACDTEGRR